MSSSNPLPTELLELHARVVEAKGLKNTQTFGKMDPYVVARVNASEAKSQVAQDGHSSPTFGWKTMLNGTINDNAVFTINNKAAIGADVVIGSAMLSLASLMDGQVADIWLTLKQGSEVTGELHVRAQLMRSGERPIGKAADLAAAGKSALAAGFGAPAPAPAPAPVSYQAPPPQYAPQPSPYQQPPPPQYPAYPQQMSPAPAPYPAAAYGQAPPPYPGAPAPMMAPGYAAPPPMVVPVSTMMPVPQPAPVMMAPTMGYAAPVAYAPTYYY